MSAQPQELALSQEGLECVDFETQRLEIFDFDNTVAQTFEAKEGGVGVEQAYELAVGEVFGPGARGFYVVTGGLKNRAPREVVEDIIDNSDGAMGIAKMGIQSAWSKISEDDHEELALLRDVDEMLETDPVQALSELLVHRKLQHLVDQIDESWPKPVPGFIEMWDELCRDPKVNTAIISSGHTKFIEKVFETWGMPTPDITVSDDDMRRRKDPRAKPDPFGVALVHQQWLRMHGGFSMERAMSSKARMRYSGDDPSKDGDMASRSQIEFVHVETQVGWASEPEAVQRAGWLALSVTDRATA